MGEDMIVAPLHPQMTLAHLGFIPEILLDSDPRPMKEQINDRYRHGGGWHPISGMTLRDDGTMHFPGDPPFKPVAKLMLTDGRSEFAYFYEHDFVAIVQADGSYEVSRMD
jgi:hypothetical protein